MICVFETLKKGEKINRQQLQILRNLEKSPLNFWKIVRKVNGTLKELLNNLDELKKKNIISYNNKKFFLKKKLPKKPDFEMIKKEMKGLEGKRPPAKNEFFQDPIVTEHIIKRLRLIYEKGDLEGKKFFILGDDDLFSIAISLTGLAEKVTIVEIDKEVVNLIKEIAKRKKLKIEILNYNCANPLPKRLKGKFDVAILDPAETDKGFLTFLSRAIEAIKHPGAVYFGLTEIECPPFLWHKFQKEINRMNLIITDIYPKFSFYDERMKGLSSKELKELQKKNYEGLKLFKEASFTISYPRINWYHSSFLRLQTIKKPKPTIKGRVKFDESFYKNKYILTI